MSYTVTIVKNEQVKSMKQGEWTTVDKRPWTESEMQASANYWDKSVDKEPLKEIRGYAPDREVIESKEVQVLRQTIDTLDLAAVIKAINGL